MISNTSIIAIKQRLPVSKLVSRYVNLRAKGPGEFLGLCPFHQEKTPSFTVSDRKEFYYCFGCGAHGDIFRFIMETDGGHYVDAIKKLAAEVGINIEYTRPQETKKPEHELFLEILNETAIFYQKMLYTQEGSVAVNYIKSRQIPSALVAEFRLGYAPRDHTLLLNHLEQRFAKNDIIASQVLVSSERGIYNPFKERLIFPILDKSSNVIAFGGRKLHENLNSPKYINSAESVLFDKSNSLYNIDLAQKAAYKEKKIFIVEGYMDVLALAKIGLYNVVAPLGANVHAEQIKTLWRITNTPTLALDSDIAGSKASLKLAKDIMPFLQPGYSIEYLQIPNAKDPDEFIKKHGAVAFKNLTQKTVQLSDYIFDEHLKLINIKTPEQISFLKATLKTLAQNIEHRDLQHSYITYFNQKLYTHLFKAKTPKNSKHKSNYNELEYIQNAMYKMEDLYLADMLTVALQHKELLTEDVVHILLDIEFNTTGLDKIRDYALQIVNHPAIEQEELKEKIAYLRSIGGSSINDTAEAKKILDMAIKVYNLKKVQAQIAQCTALLLENSDTNIMETLLSLKLHEEALQKEINNL